jgi:rhodanese-related sulfurtransferase
MTPEEAADAVAHGTCSWTSGRSSSARDGLIPGAHLVSRNVLEWRLDPRSESSSPELARGDCRVILLCDEGYQSSLAAVTLRKFGLDATDVIGGAQAWIQSGLTVEPEGFVRDTADQD